MFPKLPLKIPKSKTFFYEFSVPLPVAALCFGSTPVLKYGGQLRVKLFMVVTTFYLCRL